MNLKDVDPFCSFPTARPMSTSVAELLQSASTQQETGKRYSLLAPFTLHVYEYSG